MFLEKEYILTTPREHRKKFAQFFTPENIAELMTEWILQDENFETLLEPAFGLGIFSRMILRKKTGVRITGFDVDKKIFEKAKEIFKNNNQISLHLQDYLFNDWQNKYDRIICNPPYFKFHDYNNKETLQEIEKRLNISLSGFTNIYTLFLLKSIYQLNEHGRIAYIVPSEFLNADYGKKVKDFLVQSKLLRHIIIFDFKENIFDNALTTSAILLLAHDEHDDAVQFSVVSGTHELKAVRKLIQEYPGKKSGILIPLKQIHPGIKWRKYYQTQHSNKYKHLIPFKEVAKVVRGIATGANDYFVFNTEKAKKYKIKDENLMPCVTKSKDVQTPFFTENEFLKLKNNNANIFLFDGTKNPDEHVKKYIELGEKNGIHQKYLTSRRNPWYAPENRPPAPIWVGVFNRKGLKFIRNEANIRNLTAFHGIYPANNLFHNINIDLLFAYLLTDIAQEIFNDNRREYGDGLKKFEPNDLNNAMMLDLSRLTPAEKEQILHLYSQYRNSVLDGKENKSFIKKINDILAKKYLK